jgi:hypothetical protein
MKKSALIIVFVAVVFAIACRGEDSKLRRDQQEYDVVQEGAGGAVTSTLQAPGEVAPPLVPPMTGTNADTTTAFTLPTATDTTQSGPPGTIAGTFTTGTPSSDPGWRPSPRPAPAPPTPVPQPQPSPQPTQTSDPAPQPVPPTNTTTTTTTTQEPREEEPEPEPQPEPQPPPQPEPQPPPPPPPPPSDTNP